MKKWMDPVNQEDIVKLAAMECFTSCLLTYLNITKRDYNHMLLDYWNVNYQFRTLLSSKDARQMMPSFYYNVEMKFVKAGIEELFPLIREEGCAVFLCKASKLGYFPRKMLGLEDSGFQHSILIYGWNEQTSQYLIIDPMVDYIGEISADELEAAGCKGDRFKEVLYFTLKDGTASFQEPTAEQLFSFSSERNLMLYDHDQIKKEQIHSEQQGISRDQSKQISWIEWFSNRHGGVKALEMFAKDIEASSEWKMTMRNSWIERNTLTLSSIMLLRSLVWNSYTRLEVMDKEQLETGGNRVNEIRSIWRMLIFQMMKYKNLDTSQEEQRQLLLRTVARLKTEEMEFLGWINQIGVAMQLKKV